MGEARKIAAILAADVVGFSRLTGADEDRTLARLRALRSDLIDPTIAVHNGRVVKRTGDGALVEFRSVVDAVRCAIEVQNGMVERNAGLPPERRIDFRIGIHLGDIVEESDGDLMGDGVNIAARLEGTAEPGGICLSNAAYEQVRDKLKESFVDLGDQALKNIARPIRVYRLDLAPKTTSGSVATQPLPALPDKPSIAVLPFQNLSDDPEQQYFTDGMVEDIITGLSRIKWLFVIARNSSFAYKGKSPDIRQVGRELGVRYVLEGSVRKAGDRIRITGQLIEAETGSHLWAERYDGDLEDVFDLQDKITETIVGIIEPNLRRAEIERARRKRPDNLGAYDLYLRALPHMASGMPEDANFGMGLLEKALNLDPDYAAAHAFLAWGFEMRVARGGFDEVDKVAGVRHGRAALVHGTDDAMALAIASIALLHLGHDFEAASGAIARALMLNGSCATALFFGAQMHAFSGDPAVAEDYANRALRLSPFDPFSFVAHLARGFVRLRDGRYADAASHFAKAAQVNPRFSTIHACQAAALAMDGHIDESKAVARRVLELEPTFHFRLFTDFFAFARPEILSAFSSGCRHAGLPE
ncbi:MAG: adenylate/guanylate cyclase domain-containing protein [Xanthobacteraceae bacterium]